MVRTAKTRTKGNPARQFLRSKRTYVEVEKGVSGTVIVRGKKIFSTRFTEQVCALAKNSRPPFSERKKKSGNRMLSKNPFRPAHSWSDGPSPLPPSHLPSPHHVLPPPTLFHHHFRVLVHFFRGRRAGGGEGGAIRCKSAEF